MFKLFTTLFLLSASTWTCVHSTESFQQVRATSSNENQRTLLRERNRTALLNFLIKTYGYKNYLEIGVCDGYNYDQIVAPYKVGVDPSPLSPANRLMTSDAFFAQNQEKFDLIFIDGLHLCEQVIRDIENSLQCLNPGGRIVMHDCMPNVMEEQVRTPPVIGAWTGDVWKAAAYARMHYNPIHFCVIDMDFGCGVITPGITQTLAPEVPFENLDWNFYINNRKKLLNIVSLESWIRNPTP